MKKQTLAIVAVVAIALGILFLLGHHAVKATTRNSKPQRIYLPEGTTYADLRDTLSHNGIVDLTSPHTLFDIKAHLRGLHKSVRSGSYLIAPHTREHILIQKLYRGQQDPIRLAIGKHRTPAQLQTYLDEKLMHNGFHFDTSQFYIVRPDTYEVYWTITPEAFRQRMEREYDTFWKKSITTSDGGNAPRSHLSNRVVPSLTASQIVVLASIVEEETNATAEKPLIASVYLNRLRIGMPLQADPTVKYAVGDFALRRILNVHLQTPSPYNTYLHTGLPPTPICLPSATSIDAVLRAPRTDYLYFCASPALDGTHRFAATLSEHNRNAAAYHAALNAKGIH